MDHGSMGEAMPMGDAMDPTMPMDQMDHGAMDHGAMDHGAMDHGAMDPAMAMDHGAMDHGAMDPAMPMDHAATGGDAMAMPVPLAPIPLAPPPPEAGSGPARAAEAIYGAEAMREAREALKHDTGGQSFAWFMADRAEYRARQGRDGYLWDVQGYYGGDIDKFWFKSEGEGSFGEKPEQAEVQALWSHAIGPWFDLQAGVRQDLAGPDRTHAVIGVQGLAPYLFDIDAAAFLSNKGDVTARIEAEYDQRITQRLILQPRGEVNLAAQDIPALGIGAGIDSLELGVRLRYEFAREFAPYIGVEQEWKLGGSADFARAAGHDPSVTNYVAGVRFWF
ncbi:copper resistance protein B [Sphingorhabdus soli]|uniref:Copper resistance protein B n=2 Tax=Flavisphingopyxis soli TaxID=2601267 RepID=A0A5C6UBR1_9SPHN|nr:copper resistance protein B [Sphingorhabdus soli]